MTLEGTTIDLPPGGQQTMDVLVGASSCTPAEGYTVAPGTYEVRAELQLTSDASRFFDAAPLRIVGADR